MRYEWTILISSMTRLALKPADERILSDHNAPNIRRVRLGLLGGRRAPNLTLNAEPHTLPRRNPARYAIEPGSLEGFRRAVRREKISSFVRR